MIRIENVSKAYGERIILKNINYHFPQGERIALIGANGQGKTTLLSILVNPGESDDGKIIQPNSMRLGYLAQAPRPKPCETILEECMAGHQELADIHHKMTLALHKMETDYSEQVHEDYDNLLNAYIQGNGYEWEGLAEKVLLGLGFTTEQLNHPPQSLSGGWRMRLELARILVSKPDFMILDEPTNHLDLPTIEWLEEYLLDYEGTLVFVSHDKAFLNNLATITLYLNHGTLTAYAGNFDDFMEQRDQTSQTQAATARKIVERKAHMQKFVDRFRGQPTKAGQVGSRKKMIDRLNAVISGLPQEEAQAHIHMPKLTVPTCGKVVVTLNDLRIGYDSAKPLNKKMSTTILKGEKVAILGANGIGKSTLLKTIAGTIPPLGGDFELGHNVMMHFFTQDAADKLEKSKKVFDTLQEANPELSHQTLMSVLGAFLFRGNDVRKLVSVLSGGEKSRLALACLLAQPGNFLMLDEPTNHLDIASTNILAEMINTYPGTILYVSHDRDFVSETANRILEIR